MNIKSWPCKPTISQYTLESTCFLLLLIIISCLIRITMSWVRFQGTLSAFYGRSGFHEHRNLKFTEENLVQPLCDKADDVSYVTYNQYCLERHYGNDSSKGYQNGQEGWILYQPRHRISSICYIITTIFTLLLANLKPSQNSADGRLVIKCW